MLVVLKVAYRGISERGPPKHENECCVLHFLQRWEPPSRAKLRPVLALGYQIEASVQYVLRLVLLAQVEPPDKVGAYNFSHLASHVDNVGDCCMGCPEGRLCMAPNCVR